VVFGDDDVIKFFLAIFEKSSKKFLKFFFSLIFNFFYFLEFFPTDLRTLFLDRKKIFNGNFLDFEKISDLGFFFIKFVKFPTESYIGGPVVGERFDAGLLLRSMLNGIL
jgi:hypothetical protein